MSSQLMGNSDLLLCTRDTIERKNQIRKRYKKEKLVGSLSGFDTLIYLCSRLKCQKIN